MIDKPPMETILEERNFRELSEHERLLLDTQVNIIHANTLKEDRESRVIRLGILSLEYIREKLGDALFVKFIDKFDIITSKEGADFIIESRRNILSKSDE